MNVSQPSTTTSSPSLFLKADKAPPNKVVLDLTEHVKELRVWLSEPRMPTVGCDEALTVIFDAISERQTAVQELHHAKRAFVPLGRLLDEDPDDIEFADWNSYDMPDDPLVLDTVSMAINRIGHAILSELKQLNLFEGGILNYEYDQTIPHGVVLRRK